MERSSVLLSNVHIIHHVDFRDAFLMPYLRGLSIRPEFFFSSLSSSSQVHNLCTPIQEVRIPRATRVSPRNFLLISEFNVYCDDFIARRHRSAPQFHKNETGRWRALAECRELEEPDPL